MPASASSRPGRRRPAQRRDRVAGESHVARARRAWLILLCVALVVGGLSLPVAATLLDGRFGGVGLVVVQVAAAVGVCAGAGAALPEAASHPSTRARGAALGAALGLVAAVSSDFVLFVLLRG